MTETKEAPTKMVVQDTGPLAYMFDTARFEHTWRIATAIAAATLLPDHLRLGKDKKALAAKQIESNIFRIVNQAIRWGVDPYAVIDCTYVVGNKLGFEGKLVAGIVNARAGLKGRLDYSYVGEGENRTITVSGTFHDEIEVRTIDLSVGQAKTSNKMWTTDPDQKLVYSGVTKWARRHCPEIMLGVLTDDDLEIMKAQSKITDCRVVDQPSLTESITLAAKAKAEINADDDAKEAATPDDRPVECDESLAKVPPDEPAPDAPRTHPAKTLFDGTGDEPELALDGYRQLYEEAALIKRIPDRLSVIADLDAKAKADRLVASNPARAAIRQFSMKARE